jgi:hypothetical protein
MLMSMNIESYIYMEKDELPIRLAHRVVELDNLPDNLSKMPSVIKVKNWYAQSFQASMSQV